MDQLAKDAAEIAFRLASFSTDPQRRAEAVDNLEQLAFKVLNAVSAARAGTASYDAGATRGMWRAVPATPKQ